MAEFDPFEREFRRQAAGLRRTPSPRSWSRVERRLDRRQRGGHILTLRPWMIAAVLLLVAGFFTLSELAAGNDNVLAQRSESVYELSAPYMPLEDFAPGDFTGEPQKAERNAEFRDVMVAKEYRIAG